MLLLIVYVFQPEFILIYNYYIANQISNNRNSHNKCYLRVIFDVTLLCFFNLFLSFYSTVPYIAVYLSTWLTFQIFNSLHFKKIVRKPDIKNAWVFYQIPQSLLFSPRGTIVEHPMQRVHRVDSRIKRFVKEHYMREINIP